MTITRNLAVLSLTIVGLLSTHEAAKADTLRDIFRTIGQVQVAVGGGPRHLSPGHGPGYVQPPSYGYPRPDCHTEICPPPPPVQHCVYCVYYLDCHGHWNLYRCFHSRWTATSAEQQLQHQGYRTYLKVKHLGGQGGGYPDGPGGYPAGTPASPAVFGR